ncbi:hypothetical protein E5I20_07310 [Campylobacter coli]|nr:hypothetical protein [Campylobacter coli]EAK0103505.1 hypothetical protein [Campylobacter coli]EDC2883069.1 hypothetical protein [Campylobacter coli]EIR1325396.1 hypothetical protein [Campylobacter coli]
MKLQDFDFRIWDNIEKKYIKSQNGLYIANSEHNFHQCNRLIENLLQSEFYMCEPFNGSNKEYGTNENAFLIELWTGYYDKNHKKIYEGDILEDMESRVCDIYEVVFKEGAFYLSDIESGDEDLMSEFLLTELEIIGNIHENHELLKC